MHEGDYSRARALFEQAHAAEPRWSTLWGVLSSLGAVALREGDYAAARELFEQDLRVHEQRKSKRLIADALHNLGDVACCQRDHAAARSFYRRSLTMWRELGERRAIASSLEAFALLALAEAQAGDPGRWSRSARLLAAAEALRTALGAALPPVHRGEWERGVAAVEAALGAEALVAGWAEGRAMSLDEAICCALEI
jgi:tetratricopeptide (TPR) repeat protein